MKRRHFLISAGISGAWIATASPILVPQTPVWQPDGAGTRGRIGVLTPDFDPVPESEAWAMAPQGVSILASRVPWKPNDARTFADAPNVDEAVERLATTKPQVILYAFTSSSYMLGQDGDKALRERLERKSQGIPVVLAAEAASEALRALNLQRIVVVHPPWFDEETNQRGGDYFRDAGFEIISCTTMTPSRPFKEVSAAEVYDWIKTNVPRQAEGVLLAGNGMRSIGVIKALEASLNRPVLAANQFTLWQGLRVAGITASISNYGKLFQL